MNNKTNADLDLDLSLTFSDDNKDNALNFVRTDVWDTYQSICDLKWNKLTNKQKKRVGKPEIFLLNKNFAISVLCGTYDSALKCIQDNKLMTKQEIKRYKVLKNNLRALEMDDIIK